MFVALSLLLVAVCLLPGAAKLADHRRCGNPPHDSGKEMAPALLALAVRQAEVDAAVTQG